MFVEIVPIFVTRQKGKHESIRIHPLPCNASVPSLIHRNSNFAFPGTVLPKSTSALQGTEPNQMVNRSGVSFPVMAPFSQPQSSYILNQDIASRRRRASVLLRDSKQAGKHKLPAAPTAAEALQTAATICVPVYGLRSLLRFAVGAGKVSSRSAAHAVDMSGSIRERSRSPAPSLTAGRASPTSVP